jgi:hypothetical protein
VVSYINVFGLKTSFYLRLSFGTGDRICGQSDDDRSNTGN